MSWDHTFGPTQIQPLLRRRQQLATEPQSAAGIHRQLERQVLSAQRSGLQREPGQFHFQQRLRRLGRQRQQRLREHRLRVQRRLHLGQGQAHLQVRRHVPVDPLQRFRPPVHLAAAWASASRKPGVAAIRILPPRAAILSLRSCLGYADSGQLDTIRFIGQQFPYFAGYVQDDWRVSRKLTMNLGVRWETQLPPTGLERRLDATSRRPRRIPPPAAFRARCSLPVPAPAG